MAKHITTDWFWGLLRAAKMYVPVHFVPMLLFKSRTLLKVDVCLTMECFAGFCPSMRDVIMSASRHRVWFLCRNQFASTAHGNRKGDAAVVYLPLHLRFLREGPFQPTSAAHALRIPVDCNPKSETILHAAIGVDVFLAKLPPVGLTVVSAPPARVFV